MNANKPRLILHIGTMKTGTTSIQQVFDVRRADMLAQGAYYPQSPGTRAHELLTYAATNGERGPRPDDPFWRGIDRTERLARFREEFAAEMAAIPPHVNRVVISDERFSFYLRTPAHLAALHAMLRPHFDNIEVVAYLRRQDSFLASRYAEQLRVGAVGEPDHKRDNAERMQDYDYRRLLEDWAAVFGAAAIKPRIYERGAHKTFDSVSDFMASCGIDLVVNPGDTGARSNPSMNLAGQQVLREVGSMLQKKTGARSVVGPLWRRISDAVTEALPGKGWMPTRAEAAEFMARFEDGNEAVRHRYFPDRATLFADDSANFPVDAAEIGPEAKFVAACAALLEVAERSQKREATLERAAAKAVQDAKARQDAKLGQNARLGQNAKRGQDAKAGQNARLGQNAKASADA